MNFLLVLAFAIANLWKGSFISPDIHISILDLVVGLLFIKNRCISKPIWMFFAVGLVSLLINVPTYGYVAGLVGALYLLRWLAYSSVIIKNGYKLLPVLGLVLIITGLGQYLLFPDIRGLQVLDWDPHYYRVVGTFLDPGFTGILLVFTLIYFTFIKNKLLWALAYITFALTYSRSSYLAFLVAMAYIAWQKKSWRFILGILLLFTLTLTILPRAPDGEGVKLERTNSILARINSWKTAGGIFLTHPLFGTGFNIYRYAQGENLHNHAGAGADSSLLFVLATTGIIGFVIYLWYLKRIQMVFLLPLLVHSLFLNSLFYPAVMVWLVLISGVSFDFRTDPKLEK